MRQGKIEIEREENEAKKDRKRRTNKKRKK